MAILLTDYIHSVCYAAMKPPPAPITHVALTVRDLGRSVGWYTKLFGEPPSFEGEFLRGTENHYTVAIWRVPNLGLHCFTDVKPESFSARRVGLDHLALTCGSDDDMQAWVEHLDRLSVPHGGVLHEPYGSGLSFVDPDGIALEIFLAAKDRTAVA